MYEGGPSAFDLGDDIFESDHVRAGGLSLLTELVVVRDDHDTHFLAGTARERDGSADGLVGLLRVDPELESDFDRLVELHAREFLEQCGRLGQRVAFELVETLQLCSVKFASFRHLPPRYPYCGQYPR